MPPRWTWYEGLGFPGRHRECSSTLLARSLLPSLSPSGVTHRDAGDPGWGFHRGEASAPWDRAAFGRSSERHWPLGNSPTHKRSGSGQVLEAWLVEAGDRVRGVAVAIPRLKLGRSFCGLG